MSVPAGSIRCLQYPFVTRRVECVHRFQKIALTAIVDLQTNSVTRGPSTSFDEFSLADIYYSLEHVADVLSAVNGWQAQHP